jgi:hypothetical protein
MNNDYLLCQDLRLALPFNQYYIPAVTAYPRCCPFSQGCRVPSLRVWTLPVPVAAHEHQAVTRRSCAQIMFQRIEVETGIRTSLVECGSGITDVRSQKSGASRIGRKSPTRAILKVKTIALATQTGRIRLGRREMLRCPELQSFAELGSQQNVEGIEASR